MLKVKHLNKSFGGLKAVDNCSFNVKKNCITGLIGPNGAGKTTIFNLITGYLKPDSGTVHFKDEEITNIRPHKRARKGISRSFQSIRLFPTLSVLDNLMIAFKEDMQKLSHSFVPRKANQQKLKEKSLKILKRLNLEDKINLNAQDLSFGQKKLLEIGRCMATESKIILLDEPAAGINPTMLKAVEKLLKELHEEGKTLFIIEHNMPFIMKMAEEIIVLDYGKELAVGTPKEIQNNKRVVEAYLGKRKSNK